MNTRARYALPCLLFVAAALCGCHNAPIADPVQASTPLPVVQGRQAVPDPPLATTKTPIKDALDALLAKQGASPFPKGTQLIGVNIKDGIATVNFSKEFNALANNGDSVESAAQKSLRATLAKFPEVQKMRVTVEDKPFDSQNTDWTTPFPVRDGAPNTSGDAQGGRQ